MGENLSSYFQLFDCSAPCEHFNALLPLFFKSFPTEQQRASAFFGINIIILYLFLSTKSGYIIKMGTDM